MVSRLVPMRAAIRASVLLSCLASGAPAHAQQVDALRVDAVFSDIDAAGPGCAVGVSRAGVLAHANGYGMANLDYGMPITPTSNFYLGSVGKQFTAAAIAHAARAGHLSLDDPIQKWLPGIPEYERPVTIRHLLHHTSGIRDYLGLLNLAGERWEDIHTREEILALISRQKHANFPAGDEYLYSNSGYFLLAEIVGKATGKSLRDYMDEHFLQPLGMRRSRFNDDRNEPMDARVVGYERAGDGYEMSHPWNFDQVGSGGMYSSIEDLARWDRNWYTEEVGGPAFSEQLSERGVLTDGTEIPYAFGLAHGEYRGLGTISHGGALAAFRSEVLRFPDEETTILVACSFPTSNPAGRARQVADVVLASRLAPVAEEDEAGNAAGDPEPVDLTAEQLDAFTGHWRASSGVQVEIVREGEELVFIQSENRTTLLVAGEDHILLTAANAEMRLSELIDGRFRSMAVEQNGNRFTAERYDPDAPGADYGDLFGDYYSEELDITFTLFGEDGKLMMNAGPGREGEFRPVGEDRFVAPAFSFAVDREAGRVTGFTVDAGRVRGIFFQRVP